MFIVASQGFKIWVLTLQENS